MAEPTENHSVRQQQEVDKNYETFRAELPALLKSHAGKFALMKDGEIVEFYDTAGDAWRTGNQRYADGIFSIQKVTDSIDDLGYFSHVVP